MFITGKFGRVLFLRDFQNVIIQIYLKLSKIKKTSPQATPNAKVPITLTSGRVWADDELKSVSSFSIRCCLLTDKGRSSRHTLTTRTRS